VVNGEQHRPHTHTAPDVYRHELPRDGHAELIAVVKRCKGKVVVSGYANTLYDRELKKWKRHAFNLPNHAAGGASKRRMVECVWCNF
jgi:DNA adenine methylase